MVLPARPASPKDKAKVEVAVQVAQRWILARLRNQVFFSLDELNRRIWELLEELNDRKMRVYGASRRELFERHDRPALRPLPKTRFVHGEWKRVRVNVDYHVEIDRHYYSVPHELVHEELEVRLAAATVEIFRRGERVASHPRTLDRSRPTISRSNRQSDGSQTSADSPRPASLRPRPAQRLSNAGSNGY